MGLIVSGWIANALACRNVCGRIRSGGRALMVLFSALMLPACAQAADCLSEAEVEAAVREQLQAGAFAVRTDMLRDRPLCSGLTMAQTIQNISARHASAKAQSQAPAPVAAASQRPADAGTRDALPDITDTLRFENPRLCESVAQAKFFASAEKAGSAVLGPLGRVAVSRSEASKDGTVTRHAPILAKWHGLTLTALEYTTAPYGAYNEVRLYRMVFAEPGRISGPVLGRLGFGVSRPGQTNEIYDQDTMMDPYYVSLKHHGQGSELECF